MEEQVSHISDLEGLNSELEGFLSDLHGREESLSVRVRALEEELSGARSSAASVMSRLEQKEASLSAALEQARAELLDESSRVSALATERENLARQLEALSIRLEESKTAAAEKDALLKEIRMSAKQESSRSAAAAEELRASLNNESSRASALVTERENVLRQLAVLSDRLEEAKAAAAEKEALLREARISARQDAVKFSAAIEELRVSLDNESSRASSLALERDDLDRRLQGLAELLEETKGALSEKDVLMKEARAAAKEKAAELSAAIDQLRSSLAEESQKVSGLALERLGLLMKIEKADTLLAEEKTASSKKESLFNEARAADKGKAAELSAAIYKLKESLLSESSKVEAMILERDELLRRLETEARTLEAEKARSAEKDALVNGVRSALKDKDGEIDRMLRGVEELKADLSLERANVKDREAQLQKALKMQEGLERRLEQAAQENSRSEEGFLLKIELVKKELREQVSRAGEIERKLAAAGARLDDALEEAGEKEKMLAEANAVLTEKDAQLKAANHKLKELAKEFSEVKSGSGRENARRSMELAASMASRVEELETALADASALSLEKFRASQAELSGARSALRAKEEENASLRARENSLSGELADAEEKWKLASAQLHNAASRLRNTENENEIIFGRLKSVEEERDKFRTAAIRAETTSSAMAIMESKARDGEASGLVSALEDQAAAYTAMLRKYDDVVLLNETLAREKAGARAEADSLRDALTAAQNAVEAESGEKRGLQSGLSGKLRSAEALLKKKEFELEEARAAADASAREAEAERARNSALSEKMHNADVLLRKKEFELEEAKGALSGLESECSMLRKSRAELGEKYAREIQAENELLKEARARVVDRDSFIARLSITEEELKNETEALKKEKQNLLTLMRKKSAAPAHSAKVSEAERLLSEKESRLVKLRAELEDTRAEKAELQGREKELREELKSRPYRAMLREAEEKLLIKEKMLAEVNSRMNKIGRDFAELKGRGQSAGAPGYLPDFEELVAGVAHQVANSISIIRSHAEFCAETPEADGAKESLGVIVRNIVNLQKKIDTIMNFSRPVIPQRSPERLAAVLSEILAGLRSSGRLENIKVLLNGGDELKPVGLDRVRFASAVEQLLLNAVEAMPGGGELSVVLSGGGGKQRLEVSDTGPGVERKYLGAIFHPFFTTRPGKMGLGLTLARNVVRAHGGTLELLSEPGKGARAVLELPEI